jgi:GxxExxY protein
MIPVFICSAVRVAKALGAGHSEALYQKALCLDLNRSGVSTFPEFHVPVTYPIIDENSITRMYNIGDERIDIMIFTKDDASFIVELKAIQGKLRDIERQQLKKYHRLLATQGIHPVGGFLMNYRQAGLLSFPLEDEDLRAFIELEYYDFEENSSARIDVVEPDHPPVVEIKL